MKLLGSTKSKITKDVIKRCENVPHLEITEEGSIQFNHANNNYQQDSRVLNNFVPNKLLHQLYF